MGAWHLLSVVEARGCPEKMAMQARFAPGETQLSAPAYVASSHAFTAQRRTIYNSSKSIEHETGNAQPPIRLMLLMNS